MKAEVIKPTPRRGVVSAEDMLTDFGATTPRKLRPAIPFLDASADLPAGGRLGLLSPALVRSGYVPRHPFLDAALNRGTAALLLVMLAPLFLMISAGIFLTSGRPVLYSGARIGRGMRDFDILKFRTLVPDAERQTQSGTLPTRSMLETRFGSYLRKSRLDELPQLINILLGEMVFFGPRPIRRALLDIFERDSPGFRVRFNVTPGLVGMSQALLPHSANKRLRGRFNAMCCRAPIRYSAAFGFVALVGLSVVRRSISGAIAALLNPRSPLRQFNFLRSGFAIPRDATARFDADGEEWLAGVVGISDQVIQLGLLLPIAKGEYRLRIAQRLSSGRIVRIEVDARVTSIVPVGPGQSGFIAYATYFPKSVYQLYRIQRYLLDDTVIPA